MLELQSDHQSIDTTWRLLAGDLRPDECMEMRVFKGGDGPFSMPRVAYAVAIDEFRRLVLEAQFAHATTYVGVNPRRRERYDLAPGNWADAKGRCSGDEHVTRRIWLFLDCDPVRADGFKKFNATDAEKAALINAVQEMVSALPFTSYAVADSGNGAYVMVRIDLPVDAETNKRFEAWFKAELQKRFNGPAMHLDSVFDPSRVMKGVGGVGWGKQEAQDRPVRVSRWLSVPEQMTVDDSLRAKILNYSGSPTKKSASAHGVQAADARISEDSWLVDGPPPMEKLKTLRQRDAKVAALLDGKADWLRDGSGSGYDMALAARLARSGFTENEVYRTLRGYPHGSKGEAGRNGERYYRRTLEKAFASAATVTLDDLGDLVVLGEDAAGEIVLYNPRTRTIRSFAAAQFRYEDLLLLVGAQALEQVTAPRHKPQQILIDGARVQQIDFDSLRHQIAIRAGERKLGECKEIGNGTWPLDDGLLLVGDEVMELTGQTVTPITTPLYKKLFIKRDGNRPRLPVKALLEAAAKADPKRTKALTLTLYKLVEQWNLKRKSDAWLLVGLALATHLQAVWRWRPQVWLTGPTNAAKSLLMKFLSRILGPTSKLWEGRTTEAGLRQHLGVNSEPTQIDEFDDCGEGFHRARIVEFFRSAGPGGEIVKGTPGHTPVRFRVINMGWFASIEVPLERAADANRFIIIELNELKQHISAPQTVGVEEMGQELLAALLKVAPRARELEAKLGAVSVPGLQGRYVLNYAVPTAVLAALWGLSDAGAEKLLRHFIKQQAGQEVVSRESDELRLIHSILMAPMLGAQDKPSTVGRELSAASPDEDRLANVGLRVMEDPNGSPESLFIHPETVQIRLLQTTAWKGKNIRSILLRIPGAVAGQRRVGGPSLRGVIIPWHVIDVGTGAPTIVQAMAAGFRAAAATTTAAPLPFAGSSVPAARLIP